MKTGVVGMGAMGANMARNLAKAGHLQSVFNRTRSTAEEVANECNVNCAETPADLAKDCELIITCVSRDADVLEMMNALLPGIQAGTIIVDTSTVSADTAKQAAEIMQGAGAHFLDCPVSGGKEGAIHGTLAMMVGGDEAILEKARSTLDAIAAKIVYIGPTGSGQATKAVNQIMAAGINQAVTEALAFGQAMDLPMEKVIDVVSTGAAGNWFLEHRGKTMVNGTYQPGFKLALHHKDLSICQAMTKSISENALPVIEMTLIQYQRLMDQGYGNEDISALYRLKRANLDKTD